MLKDVTLTISHVSVVWFYGQSQLINYPTHLAKESSPCTDLIFAASPYLISKAGIEICLDGKCDQNLIYGMIDFKVLFNLLTWKKFTIISADWNADWSSFFKELSQQAYNIVTTL